MKTETELRDFGDGKTIVLYTNDNLVLRKFRDSAKIVKIIPYEQEQAKKGVKLVGVDLYFNKRNQKWLGGRLKSLGIKNGGCFPKLEVSPNQNLGALK